MKSFLKKQLRERDEKLKYEFLPSMIGIIEKPTNRLVVIIMFAIIAMIISSIAWAGLCKLDIVVTAMGVINSEDAVITIDTTMSGTIAEIKVKDGEYVSEGDVICILNSEELESNYKENIYNLEVLSVQKELYEQLYEKLKNNDFSSLNVDVESYGDNKKFAEYIILENDIFIEQLNEIDEEEKSKAQSRYYLSVIENINSIELKIENIDTNIESICRQIEKCTFTAPVSGKYSEVTGLYAGKRISQGDVIGYIISSERMDEFLAYVPSKDITQISVGDTVKIKIAALSDTEKEYIVGKVVSIGDVTINIDNSSSYIVKIKLEQVPEDLKIGMEGNIDIIIGTRTVLDYFLDPFKKGMDGSLKEK